MAAPTIPNGEEYFFPVIYEGNGAGQRVGRFVPFTDNGTIANSCLFENNVSSYLSRTLSSNGSGTTVTFSCWVKRDILAQGLIGSVIMMHSNISSNSEILEFNSTDNLHYYEVTSGTRKWNFATVRTFEDTSKWYHIMVARNTTEDNTDDRVKIYVDGELLTDSDFQDGSGALDLIKPAKNDTGYWNQTTYDAVVGNTNSGSYIDGAGYLAEVNMVDGTALGPETFGVTDTSTGRWIPKTLSGITYGTNGFRLKFQDSSALGDDTSGNTNDFTVANLASTDQTTDSPTQNHATFDPNFSGSIGLSEGNLVATQTLSNNWETAFMGMPVRSGKYYFEFTANSVPSFFLMGLANLDGLASTKNNHVGAVSGGVGLQLHSGNLDYIYANGGATQQSYTTSLSNGDVIGVAYDTSTGSYFVAVNNTWTNSGNPANGTNPVFSGYTPNQLVYLGISYYHNGAKFTLNTGQKSFTYTPPTGFVALQQDNLPETAKGISGLVWTKNRDSTDSNQLYDSSRGKQLVIASNATTAETTVTDGLQKFLAGGQQIEDSDAINTAGESFVTWNWVANGGSTSTNTDGSLTSTVQANTTAGFSIVEYTGNGGNAAATIGHGLSSAPEWMMVKFKDSVAAWSVYHKSVGATKRLQLNSTTTPLTDANIFNNTEPTSTVFSVGSSLNQSSVFNYIVYCWHSVEGFSKFGSYIGNGSTDGTFVYTGFRPAWVMYKNITTASQWVIMDTKRSAFNPVGLNLLANATSVEDDGGTSQRKMDILSNGFKLRVGNYTDTNKSANTYIYMAFAEHPFVGDGTSPVTAR